MTSITPVTVQNENLHVPRGKGVQGSTFGIIQNENLHSLKGKPVDGAKSGIIQNEKLHILKGKGVGGFKAEVSKPAKAGHQGRKALRDLSQSRKPVLSAAESKEKSKPKEWAAESSIFCNTLTDEQMAKCKEWAEEGIEHADYTGNDMWEFEDRQQQERINRKVAKAMSGLRGWTDISFVLDTPVKEVPSDDEDTFAWKLEPEVLPPTTPRDRWHENSDCEELDLFDVISFPEIEYQLRLKVESEYDADFV